MVGLARSLRTALAARATSTPRDRLLLAGSLLITGIALAGLAAAVAVETRRTLERQLTRALSDHASYVGRLLADEVRYRLAMRFAAVLQPAALTSSPDPRVSAAQLAQLWARAREVFPPTTDDHFGAYHFQCATRRLDVTGGAATPALRRALLDTLPVLDAADLHSVAHEVGSLLRQVGDTTIRVLLYAADATPGRCALFGITYTPRALAAVDVPEILRRVPVLPPSFQGTAWNGAESSRLIEQDSAFGVRITNVGSGTTLFDSFGRNEYPYVGAFTMSTGAYQTRFEVGMHRGLARQLRQALPETVPLVSIPALIVLAILVGLSGVVLLVGARREMGARQLLLSKVSHELRTPLTQLRLHAATLRRTHITDDVRLRAVDAVDRGAEHLSDLVENLLVFTRAQVAEWQVHPRPTDVVELLRSLLEGYAPMAARRDATIAFDAPARLTVMVDPSAIRQAVLNLLDNALKYGPAGQTVGLAVRMRHETLWVEVSDEGPGVPPAYRDSLWEPFHRLPSTSVGVPGAGLGLAVVRELIAAHGGRVTVGDSPGGGAVFVVAIPSRGS